MASDNTYGMWGEGGRRGCENQGLRPVGSTHGEGVHGGRGGLVRGREVKLGRPSPVGPALHPDSTVDTLSQDGLRQCCLARLREPFTMHTSRCHHAPNYPKRPPRCLDAPPRQDAVRQLHPV